MAKKAAKKTTSRAGGAKATSGDVGKIGKNTDLESVRRLVKLMVDNDLTEVHIEDGDVKVQLRRGCVVSPAAPAAGVVAVPAAVPAVSTGTPAAAVAPASTPPGGEDTSADEDLLEIKSPMVGTYYASPSPDADAYVSVGERVDEDRVVCIVEAMKVMNEIKAECTGTLVEVCVKNAQPVEYGQTLFKVRPD